MDKNFNIEKTKYRQDNMDKKIELLAPAGSMANLKAAVSKGADSIYLGMQQFNARQFATNFNEDFLKEAEDFIQNEND
jgi:collagenase-like PrtC family protease